MSRFSVEFIGGVVDLEIRTGNLKVQYALLTVFFSPVGLGQFSYFGIKA